jgi:hypothetical protein
MVVRVLAVSFLAELSRSKRWWWANVSRRCVRHGNAGALRANREVDRDSFFCEGSLNGRFVARLCGLKRGFEFNKSYAANCSK